MEVLSAKLMISLCFLLFRFQWHSIICTDQVDSDKSEGRNLLIKPLRFALYYQYPFFINKESIAVQSPVSTIYGLFCGHLCEHEIL